MRKQKSPSDFGFDGHDKHRLQNAMDTASNSRTFLRLQAVFLFIEGMDVQTIATISRKSIQIVYRWIRLYAKSRRPDCLYDSPRSGRPLAAKEISDKRILQELKRNPLLLGYNSTVWTVALLAKHLSAHYECSIQPWTLYRRMKQIGLRCKRPKYVYSEKDPNRAQKKGRSPES
jgi:transposase